MGLQVKFFAGDSETKRLYFGGGEDTDLKKDREIQRLDYA